MNFIILCHVCMDDENSIFFIIKCKKYHNFYHVPFFSFRIFNFLRTIKVNIYILKSYLLKFKFIVQVSSISLKFLSNNTFLIL